MTATTHTRTGLDLTAARRLARGSAQKQWLTDFATDDGLRIADHLPRRYSHATYERITVYLDKLWRAGYDLTHQLGPLRGHGNWHLHSYRPEQVNLRTIVAAFGYRPTRDSSHRWQPDALLSILAEQDDTTLANITDLLGGTCWIAWHDLPDGDYTLDTLASVLDGCRPRHNPSTSHDISRGDLLSRILNDNLSVSGNLTLAQAIVIVDGITAT